MRYSLILSLSICLALTIVDYATSAPKLDYFFPAGGQRGAAIEVTAGGKFERWPIKTWCEAKGIDVTADKAMGKLRIAIAANAEPGAYWIRLYDDSGASVARPFIVGNLPEVMDTEPNDDPRKPQVLDKSSVVVNGRLDKAGDVDTFAVKLTKGQTLVASVQAHHVLRSPMDGVLQILSADGFVLEQNDDYHEFDPQIAFTASRDGTYLVRLFAFPAMPDTVIRFAGGENYVYRLTLTTGPFIEYAMPLAVAGDAPSTVELVGWNIPAELRSFKVTPRPAERADEIKLFDARLPQPFFVRREAHAAIAKSSAMREAPQRLTPPMSVTGRLDRPGAVDVYQIPAKKGQVLSFRIEACSLGFPLEPVLRLLSGETVLATTQPAAIGADPVLDYTAQQDGDYRLEVSDLHGAGGLRHVYSLRVGPILPDFELKVPGDLYTLSPGKALDIPVTITRLGGFKGEIQLGVDGLPPAIDVAMNAKGISMKSNGKAAFSGPIRIVGTAKDGTVRHARAPVPDLGRTTDSLWLTVARP